jgi:hypothetical protein
MVFFARDQKPDYPDQLLRPLPPHYPLQLFFRRIGVAGHQSATISFKTDLSGFD